MTLPGRVERLLTSVVRDAGWAGLSEIAILLSSLVSFNILVQGLGPVDYGRYVGIAVLAGALATLSTIWVAMLLLQQVLQERVPLGEALGSALTLATVSGLIAFGVAAAIGPDLLPGIPPHVFLAFVAAELIAAIGVTVGSAAVQVERGFPAATKVRLLLAAVRLLSLVSFLAFHRLTLTGLAVWQLVWFGALGGAVIIGTARHLRLPVRPRLTSSRDIRGGLPHALVLGSLAVQEDSDKTLMVHYGHAVDAGLYAAGYKLVQLGLAPVRALVNSSHPRFLVSTPGEKNEHVRRAIRYTIPSALYGVLATLAVEVLAPVVPDVLGHQYDGTVTILRVVAPLVALRSASLFALNALLGLGRYKTRAAVILISTVINVVLNVLWIPHYSWRGAAAATLVTEVVFVVAAWAALVRGQRQDDELKELGASTPSPLVAETQTGRG